MPDIPQQFIDFADSAELYDQVKRVGDRFSLHIDQIGELDAAIADVLYGVDKAQDFSMHIAERLEIDRKAADLITQEVNQQIFEALKQKMQSQTIPEPLASVTISPLERAGNFSIEPDISTAPIGKMGGGNSMGRWGTMAPEKPVEDRSAILKHIEDPTVPASKSAGTAETAHYEPLVDQLLNGPAAIPAEKIVRKPDIPLPPKSPTVSVHSAQPPRNLPTDDPYREAV